MKVQGNIIQAEDGYVLFRRTTGENMGKTVYMGTKDVPLDFAEGKVVDVGDLSYMMTNESMTYDELATALIRMKYTLDEELALSANFRNDPEKYKSEDVAFQSWRLLCKEAARKTLGIKE